MRERRGDPLIKHRAIGESGDPVRNIGMSVAGSKPDGFVAAINVPYTHPWNEMPPEEIIFGPALVAGLTEALADGSYRIESETLYRSKTGAMQAARTMREVAVRVWQDHMEDHVSTVDGIASSTRY
jgi:hypothetical protein